MKLQLPMLDREEFITWSEDCEISHRQFLAEFNEKVWPALKEYGFSRDALLTYWTLNSVNVSIETLITEVRNRIPEGYG